MNNNFRLLSVIGTRPQYIKLAALHRAAIELEIEHDWIDTGQHYSPELSKSLIEEMKLELPKSNLGIGSGTHAEQTAKALIGIENFLTGSFYNCVLVYGDTNSTLAGALAASKLKIPVAHIEAGLRSGNQFMPEEINRKAVDSISKFLFVPTRESYLRMKAEGYENIFFSGDVMFDKSIIAELDLTSTKMKNEYILATIHREENTSTYERLNKILASLEELEHEVFIVAHPRLIKAINEFQLKVNADKIKIVNSVGRKHLLSHILGATCVITDSGGVQKEAYFLQKKCITIRENTEWTETLNEGWNILNPHLIDLNAQVKRSNPSEHKQYFGDGNASKFILETLREALS